MSVASAVFELHRGHLVMLRGFANAANTLREVHEPTDEDWERWLNQWTEAYVADYCDVFEFIERIEHGPPRPLTAAEVAARVKATYWPNTEETA